MKELLDQNDLLKPLKVGDIIEGQVVAKEKGELFLDLGAQGTGIVFGKEFQEARHIISGLKTQNKVFAKVVELKNDQGYTELSLKEVSKELAWEKLNKQKEKAELIAIKITGANKGGLLAELEGISGFLPVSQLSQQNYPKVADGDTAKILEELQKFVGREMEVQILDLDPKASKLILSEKAKESGKIKELLKKYKLGDTVQGEITGIVEFGAFVKFGGKDELEGLIHISELDWKMIEDPGLVVKMGQKIQAKIINMENDKVFLSLKALKKDPWEGIEKTYKKGDRVSCKVTKFNPFGAFAQITDEIQGLCHISEFGIQEKMEEKLILGKSYDFEILEIRPSEHKMSLKLVG